MERAEKIGIGVALAGHAVLFGLLSAGFMAPPEPAQPRTLPVEISLIDKVALESAAPPAPEPPAQSRAPEVAPPAEAPPPAPAEAEPEPAPQPEPRPAPPVRQPAPVPAPKPVPKAPPRPEKKPVAPPEKPVAKAKLTPPRPAVPATKPAAKTTKPATPPTRLASNNAATGTRPNAPTPTRKPGGLLLSDTTLKGFSATPSPSKAATPPGATMNAAAAADIGSAIKRQVQPCADRQVNPGPGASRIVVTVRLQLNRDGSLNGRPTIADAHGGVDDENERYVDAVDRNAIAAFTGCAPLRGLPPELYDVPRGWKTFILRYKLPG